MARESASPIRGTPAGGFGTAQVDVTNTPAIVVPYREGRRSVVIINHGSVDVFLGESGVSATTGALLAGTKGQGLVVNSEGPIYGVTTGATQRVSYLELY